MRSRAGGASARIGERLWGMLRVDLLGLRHLEEGSASEIRQRNTSYRSVSEWAPTIGGIPSRRTTHFTYGDYPLARVCETTFAGRIRCVWISGKNLEEPSAGFTAFRRLYEWKRNHPKHSTQTWISMKEGIMTWKRLTRSMTPRNMRHRHEFICARATVSVR